MLNPQMQENGEDIWDHLSEKYGPDAKKRFGGANSYMNQAGREVGIYFKSERFVYPTVRPHALMEYLKSKNNEKANTLMEDMYREYFEEGSNINSVEVLTRIASKVIGNDSNLVQGAMSAMEDHSLHSLVYSKDHKAKYEMKVKGVPYFIIEKNNRKRSIEFSGAQPSDIIAEQLEIAAEEN